MVQPHLFDESISAEDGAYCPHCRTIALRPSIIHGGVYKCPRCTGFFHLKIERADVYTTRKWTAGCDGCG